MVAFLRRAWSPAESTLTSDPANNQVVIAEGWMDQINNMFIVDALGHPPAAPRDSAFHHLGRGQLDVFSDNHLDRECLPRSLKLST